MMFVFFCYCCALFASKSIPQIFSYRLEAALVTSSTIYFFPSFDNQSLFVYSQKVRVYKEEWEFIKK